MTTALIVVGFVAAIGITAWLVGVFVIGGAMEEDSKLREKYWE
jgi:hypothetical protein